MNYQKREGAVNLFASTCVCMHEGYTRIHIVKLIASI